jgi:hypothetical protein
MQATDLVAGTALALGLVNLGLYGLERRELRRVSGHVTLAPRYRTTDNRRWVLLEADVTVRNSTHHAVCLNHALITSPSGHGVVIDDLFGLPHDLPAGGATTCTVPQDRLAVLDTFEEPPSHLEVVVELRHGRHRTSWHSNTVERRPPLPSAADDVAQSRGPQPPV